MIIPPPFRLWRILAGLKLEQGLRVNGGLFNFGIVQLGNFEIGGHELRACPCPRSEANAHELEVLPLYLVPFLSLVPCTLPAGRLAFTYLCRPIQIQ